jgi:hypothetical protein
MCAEVYEERYCDYRYTHRYYHDQCYPVALKEQLALKAATPEKELARAVMEQDKQKSIVQGERRELFEALKTLLYGFGRALDCEDQLARIFTNKTLEEMTVKMPKNQQDMIASVYGMGPKKYESFGDAFLQVILHYARKYARAAQNTESRRASTAAGATNGTGTMSSSSNSISRPTKVAISAAGTATAPVNVDDDDIVPLESLPCTKIDDDVVPLESISCAEIIQRKFQHAAANGYVISLE